MAPQVVAHPEARPTERTRDCGQAHYIASRRSLPRSTPRPRRAPHACNDGWVTIGQIMVDSETGEETQEYALYLCRRCADSR